MPIIYNANEICSIGIEIEKNGKIFYEIAAKKTDEKDIKKFFVELANWEDSHISVFINLKSEFNDKYPEDYVINDDNEMHLYLKAAADSHVFRKNLDIPSIISECKSLIDILKIAQQFEKDSVVLYSTMIPMVPEDLGKELVQKMLNEELKHIAIIQNKIDILT
ncbi:MAG: ferritin family protein [Chitinispirillia bacterium]|jgi:rubrerythrin